MILVLLTAIALLASLSCGSGQAEPPPEPTATGEGRSKGSLDFQPTPTPVVVVKEVTFTDTPPLTKTPLPKLTATPGPTSAFVPAVALNPTSSLLPSLPPLSTVLEAMLPDLLVCVQTALGDDQYNAIISGRQSVPPRVEHRHALPNAISSRH